MLCVFCVCVVCVQTSVCMRVCMFACTCVLETPLVLGRWVFTDKMIALILQVSTRSNKAIQDTSLPTMDTSAEDSSIESLPMVVLQGIWRKATELLSKPGHMDCLSMNSSNCCCFAIAGRSSQCPRMSHVAVIKNLFPLPLCSCSTV